MVIPVPGGAVGPESLSFEGGGDGPYTGVSDGRIIRWRANESQWADFAVTSPERDGCVGPHDHTQMEHICGRPLGLRFNVNTSELYIADAYMGLLVVGPSGGLASPVAKEVDGVAFGFTNSLDIDQNSGVVYFTDSSTRFPRRNYVSIIISGDNTGRLIKFEPKTKKTTLLVNNLKFPNGVALSQSGDFLLFVETTTCKLYKFWLKTSKAGNLEVIAQFPGFPDNIKRNRNGEFWVAINSHRGKLFEWLISNPWIGNTLVRVSPVDVTKLHSCLARLIGGNGMGIKLDRDGNVVEVLDSSKGKKWKFVSEVEEENGNLWIGSVTRSVIVKDKISSYSN
ncbi:hypothetical protein DH2020_041388 [Rehmannia glutinosa]|uniref:Strictosidine synthase conserved region domain-containing protein n=1 Tax=Rehmannia glutinosa TaxID=99300 RepID=A0ABR0UQC0_REHGL